MAISWSKLLESPNPNSYFDLEKPQRGLFSSHWDPLKTLLAGQIKFRKQNSCFISLFIERESKTI